MENINASRIFDRNGRGPDPGGDYVLYWMQTSHRFEYNYALEYAVSWANKLDKMLLIYEELACDYPWASDRIHAFYLEGMAEHRDIAEQKEINWLPVVEEEEGESRAILEGLFDGACCLVTDEYPVYFIRDRNNILAEELDIAFITVDSNGLIPLGLTEKAPYNAYFFRKIMQRHFVECFTSPPKQYPMDDLKNRSPLDWTREQREIRQKSLDCIANPAGFIAMLDIDHDVAPVELKGTRQAAVGQLNRFIRNNLKHYGDKRNDPDADATSGLSPWLHFGKISEYEVVKAVLDHQPENWDLDNITFNSGSTGGFFNGNHNIDHFLDQLITWREVGFHFAHHEPAYDQYESLPGWAMETLEKHRDDPRDYIYELEELAQSQTHDELWNAAQTQLREEGVMHNYLRMLWGKNVMQWTPNPEIALAYLIELNNRYAIDGRDPNSYSGIFWCFGRFDRAWQERPVFGKTRYMTSQSARRKLKLDEYLERYSHRK
ncbi:hypothetical protein [Fodinibius sp.]|uniref:hypothetical protein n=1 Tax=Fodinibius sp. TaxID=1872440 RepID=UPI0035676C8A